MAPRNNRVLRVIGITRISTLNQDPRSLSDQQALLRQWVADRYAGEVEWHFIEGQGSGESLDREQVVETEHLVASEKFDAVIMEDLGRHMRRMQAFIFCETCEDTETRLVAINDGIDTAGEWRLNALFAAMKHEQSNKDTSLRIKRSLRNRFVQGGVVQCPIYGYVKATDAKSDADLQKDPAAEKVYQEWFRLLDDGASFSEIGDWLNASGISPGPYCRRAEWNGQMVARITFNPILKGLRVRNRVKSKRLNKTGKYRSVKAEPDERLERHCPHLAFFTPDYYDRIVRKVRARNAACCPGRPAGHHPCLGRPKKRTVWPGQHIFCGICGRMFSYGGHGQNDHLLCTGAYQYRCWNAITVNGPLAAKKIAAAVFQELACLPEFDATLINTIREEVEQFDGQRHDRLQQLAVGLEKLDRAIANILAALRETGTSSALLAELRRLEAQKIQMQADRDDIQQSPRPNIELPSIEVVREVARQSFDSLATTSEEYGRLMRRLIPKIVVYPYQLIDHGQIVLRARFTLNLASLLPAAKECELLSTSLSRSMQVDLFDPPQRAQHRGTIIARRQAGEKEAAIAKSLGITKTAVQRAAALNRLLQRRGLDDPYIPLTSPPDDYAKLRRHRHARFRFEPLPDHHSVW